MKATSALVVLRVGGGREVFGKTIVFGIFRRNGNVYTEVVPDCKGKTLQAVIRGRVSIENIIH
jgi:transposase-like protein